MEVPCKVVQHSNTKKQITSTTYFMLDSGALAQHFIDSDYVQNTGFVLTLLTRPRRLCITDRRLSLAEDITHVVILDIVVGKHIKR